MSEAARQADVERMLHDLASASPEMRVAAANQLGRLSIEDERIARALVASRVFDPDLGVREAAAGALETPAMQALLTRNPDLQREAIQEATQKRGSVPLARDDRIPVEFERRRREESRAIYVTFGALVVLTVVMWGGFAGLGPLAFVLFIAVVLTFGVYTWGSWRCPACRAHLWDKTPRVNPLSPRGPVTCPQCHATLR